jgi:type VI secretion system secreted protein VgrG
VPVSQDRFLFEIEGASQSLRVVRFAGHEGLSELFQLDLLIASDDSAVAGEQVLGSPALFTMLGPEDENHAIHGMVCRFEQGDYGKKYALYHMTVVPRVWRLQHRSDCRIFQALTAPEIISKVLEGAGIAGSTAYRLSLQRTYRTREYCVQYRESDWAFICRLMEEEGIFFFFEHQEDKHVLVLGDDVSVHAPIAGNATIAFRPPLGALSWGENVHRFHFTEELRSGRVTTRDYDFKKPGLLIEAEAEAASGADLEIYDYPGVYELPADGKSLAAVRLEERQLHKAVGDGESGCQRLASGATFTLAEHPRESFNRDYLITRVEHRGLEPTMAEMEASADEPRYEARFTCVPANVTFRPPLVTPKPAVKGTQTAIVVGPSGEEIYTDEFGRVKVQFHWDRAGKQNEHSSCWMRVSQVWAGEGWGAMFVPRVKQEVLVDFLEGDPDRPIVVGRVYHGTNVPPYALPANKTRSAIKSSSTPGGEGFNELRFEDKKGTEEVFLHAQKDLTIDTLNDKNQTVGHDETLSVTRNRSLEVGSDQRVSVGQDEKYAVGRDRERSVGRDESESIGHDRTIEVGHDHTESIGANVVITVGKSMTLEVAEDAAETTGKQKTLTVGTSYAVDVGSSMTTKVGASQTEEIEVDKTIKVGSRLVIECGEARVTIEKSGNIKIEGKQLGVVASGPVTLQGDKVEVKSSGKVSVESSGKVEVKGSGPMQLEASGAVTVKGSNVAIN